MTIYTPSIESDLLLLNWYMDLGSGPDFEAAFSAELAPCASFMSAMSKTLLVYEADERGIWAAAWFDRQMSAGLTGIWIREDMRHWNTGVRFLADAFEFGLERFPVLIAITRSNKILEKAMTSFGWTVMGEIPWLWDGEGASVTWVDSARFNAAVAQWRPQLEARTDG